MKKLICRTYVYLFAILILLFYQCVEKGRAVEYVPIEVKMIVSNAINEKNISGDILSFIKPILSKYCGDTAFLGYDKFIHFLRLDLNKDIKVFDIKANTSVTDIGALGAESIESKSANIDDYFSDIKLPIELSSAGTLDKENFMEMLRKYFSKNPDIVPLIYSKDISDKSYEGFPTFNNIDSLKNTIALKACQNHIEKFLIIYKPPIGTVLPSDSTNNKNSSDIKDPVSPIPKSNNELIRNTLLGISNPKLSFEQRRSNANEAMKNIFSKNLVVESYINSAGVASHLWDKGHGNEYLENLATEKSIIDIKILAHKDSIPNITYLQVIEIHKQ